MFEPGDAWRDAARALFMALDKVAVARRVIDRPDALDAAAAFENWVEKQTGQRWEQLSPLQRRHVMAEIMAAGPPTIRSQVSPETLAAYQKALAELLDEHAPATAGLWIQTDYPESAPATEQPNEQDDVDTAEVARRLRKVAEESRELRLRRGSDAEGNVILRLCHTSAECAAQARSLIARTEGDENRAWEVQQDAATLLEDKASECDETRRVGHIAAVEALLHVVSERAPAADEPTHIYDPPRARVLLKAIEELEARNDLPGLLDARLRLAGWPPDTEAEPLTWFIASLRRAVASHRAFAVVFDYHTL